jgi:hypothetical protein
MLRKNAININKAEMNRTPCEHDKAYRTAKALKLKPSTITDIFLKSEAIYQLQILSD